MARAIDSEVAYQFLTEQLVKETGAFSKGVNKGLNIARSAMRNPDAIPTLTQPNEPVTLEELRKMEGKPFYDCASREWYIVDFVSGSKLYTAEGVYFDFCEEETMDRFYRRPPEGGNDVS